MALTTSAKEEGAELRPVMSVMPWSDDDSMLHQANDLMYGLAAAIVTNNPKMAMHAAEDIEAQLVTRL